MPAELNIPTRLETPKGLRIHIGLFGRRNAGKSSLINALTNQQIAIVSDVPGTTTDPVEKACELAPVGPVVFIDTAGIDDVGKLGHLRTDRTMSVLGWMDLALIAMRPVSQTMKKNFSGLSPPTKRRPLWCSTKRICMRRKRQSSAPSRVLICRL